MRQGFFVAGMILVVIGALLFSLGIVQFPYTTTEMVEVPKSEVFINESYVVPPLSCYHYHNLENFPLGPTLHLTFDVSGDESLDFWVMDEPNFIKHSSKEPYEYYDTISRPSVSSLDKLWNPPTNGTIYFVWNNTDSFTSKSVSVYFTLEWTEWENQPVTKFRPFLRREVSYLGILILSIGLVLDRYGLVSKPSPVVPKTTEET